MREEGVSGFGVDLLFFIRQQKRKLLFKITATACYPMAVIFGSFNSIDQSKYNYDI